MLAGEYVLGLLPAQDRAAFERELARNRELARAVADWQDRFLEVAPTPEPVAPAPDLWQRIEMLGATLSRAELLTLPRREILHRLFHEEAPDSLGTKALRFACSCSPNLPVLVMNLT